MRYAFRTELAAPNEARAAFIERTSGWLADRLADRGAWTGWVACADPEPVAADSQPEAVRSEPDDGEPVGLVLVQLVEKVPNPVPEPELLGYLSSLYVRPHWRGRGTGDMLLATALQFCRRSGVESVVLWPSPRSVPLYQRHGFSHRGDVMELRWASESSPELRQAAEPLSPRPGDPLDSLYR
jgi:GNAT superfamily N-acetyltransferase